MFKNKRFMGALIIIYLLVLLEILGMQTQAKEDTKEKLQEVVDNSYIENNLNIEELKDNIEKNLDNSKVINKETKQFPVHTVVEGYEFKIEENGIVEDIDKQEDNLKKNELNINEQTNNIANNETKVNEEPKEEKRETIIKYLDDEEEDKGIKISTTKDGIVTINGKSTDKLFIKISNNIQISNNAKSFEKWKLEDGIIIENGQKIKQKVTILNNTVNKGQVNVVLRTERNEALGILKLVENKTENNIFLNENIIANYIYIDKDVEIENMKFKIEITNEENNILKLEEDFKLDKGIECTIDNQGKIKLNGTSEDKLFIKTTNGIDITSDGFENTKLATTEPVLFSKDKKINVIINEIQGNCITENENQQFNFALKYQDGNIAINCQTKKNIFSQELILEKDITMAYLFISEGVTFENYIIEPVIYNNIK